METREPEQMSSDPSEERTGPDEPAGSAPSSPEALDSDGATAADSAMPTLPPRVEPAQTPLLDRPPQVEERLVSLELVDEDDSFQLRAAGDVGRLAMGDNLRLVDAREVKLTRTAPLIVEMTGAGRGPGSKGGERVLVVIDSVLSHPSGVPVALAADAALLCVEMGKTSLTAARETLQIVGAQRFLGCITLPRP